jgi:hypothetical protein
MLSVIPISRSIYTFVISILIAVPSMPVIAHGEGDWNDFMIDNKNDLVETTLEYVRKQIADIVLARKKVTTWPDPVFRQLRIELLVLHEELEYLLNHLQEEDGIHIQVKSTLLENPQAGRSVAASYAIEYALELVDYIASLEDQYAFKKELNEDGPGAYIFDLMDAYTQSMAVYKSLQQKSLEVSDNQLILDALSNRTLWQDIKFHMGRLFRWIGQDDMAESLQQMEIITGPQVPANARD